MSTTTTSEITETAITDERLVRIITLDGDEFDEVSARPVAKLAEHLSLWDYGDENDQAATINGYVSVTEAERFGANPVTHGGIEYWIAVDNDLRMCSLLRRPLNLDLEL